MGMGAPDKPEWPETDHNGTPDSSSSSSTLPSIVSRKTRMIDKTTIPQGYSIMSPSKLSNIQATSTVPPHRGSTTLVVPQPEELPTASTLAKYGIKVRDFAYESTLPPIAPVPRVPRQVQPGPRPLKRVRRNHEGDVDTPPQRRVGDASTVVEEGPSGKSKPVERQLTEPAIPNSQRPSRTWGFTDFSLRESSIGKSHHTPIQFPSRLPLVTSNLSPSSQPPLHTDSQESEPYVDTPLVTPNGSLKWPVVDNSAVPASQLDNQLQVSAPKLASFFQLGLRRSPPTDVPSQRDTSPIAPDSPTALSSPLSEAPSYPLLPMQTNNYEMPSQRPPPPSHRRTQPAPVSPQPTTSHTALSRYHLRKRPATTAPHTPTRPHSQAKHTLIAAPRQPRSFTMQSAHSLAKSQNARNSPRSRTKRKDNTNGKEDSMLIG